MNSATLGARGAEPSQEHVYQVVGGLLRGAIDHVHDGRFGEFASEPAQNMSHSGGVDWLDLFLGHGAVERPGIMRQTLSDSGL